MTLDYDSNGNLLSDGTRSLTYDPENRLMQVVSVTAGVTTTVQFLYDSDGQRYKKIEGGQTTIYAGKHYEKTGTTETKYYQALGQPVAMSKTGESVTYLYRDHLGSTSASSNDSSRSYWPYGSDRSSSGTATTDRLYTSQQYNGGVGLYYYGARFYDPLLGRFVSADSLVPNPRNPQDLNRYAYARNNPLIYTDPSGHAAIIDEDEFGRPILDPPAPPPIEQEGFANPDILSSLYIFINTGLALGPYALTKVDLSFKVLGEPTGLDIGPKILAIKPGKSSDRAVEEGGQAGIVPGYDSGKLTSSASEAPPDDEQTAASPAKAPYKQPSGSTTPQSARVQGKPCVTCGDTAPTMVANHANPLVVEYYATGAIDTERNMLT